MIIEVTGERDSRTGLIGEYLTTPAFLSLSITPFNNALIRQTMKNGHPLFLAENAVLDTERPAQPPTMIVLNKVSVNLGPFNVYGLQTQGPKPYYWAFTVDPTYHIDHATYGLTARSTYSVNEETPEVLFHNDTFSVVQSPTMAVLSLSNLIFGDV